MQIGAGSFPYARICPPYPFKHALRMNSGENELLPVSPPPDLVSIVHVLFKIYAIFPRMPNPNRPLFGIESSAYVCRKILLVF